MAKIVATTYVPAEKANPFIEIVAPFVEAGIDTAFEVTFDEVDYKREKLMIQRAVNELGASAREVQCDARPEAGTIGSTFVIRPQRKARKAVEHDSAEPADLAD